MGILADVLGDEAMSRCVIVGGADIGNYEYIRSRLRIDDFVVYCDSGLKHMEALHKCDRT